MKSCLVATAMLMVTTVALALVFNLAISTAQNSPSTLLNAVDQQFVRFLAKNDSINFNENLNGRLIESLSGPIKELVGNGGTLNRFSAADILSKPEWKFLENSSWSVDNQDLIDIAENVDWMYLDRLVSVYTKSPTIDTLKALLKNKPSQIGEQLSDLLNFVYDGDSQNGWPYQLAREMFSVDPKLVLLQPKRDFLLSEPLLDIANGEWSENSWDGVDVCHRRLWYGSLPDDYPVEQLLSKPELRPLLVGASDAKLSAWMENWTEDKHNILTRHLLKASKFLSPSQVQILAAPLLSGDVSMFKKTVFNMLDVTQLKGLEWADVRENVTAMAFKCHLLTVASNSGTDLSDLSNATDSSALFLFPALQLQSAVDSGSLLVTPEVFEAAKSPRLSRGQASVLVTEAFKSINGKTNEEKNQALTQFPQEYLFAMPFMIILTLSQNKDVKDALNWRENFANNYQRLLPSQRLAIAWALTKDATNDFITFNFANGEVQDIDAVEMMNFLSPKMFNKATSNNRDLKLAGDDFCASTIDDPLLSNKMSDFNLLYKELRSKQSNDIVTLPLELRRCVVDKYQKYLEAKSQIYQVQAMPPTISEAYLGGIFWTGFRPFMEGKTGYDAKVLSQMAQGLGLYSLPELLAVATLDELEAVVTSVTKAMREERGYKLYDPSLTFSEMATLGNLALFAGDQFNEAEEFGRFLTSLEDFRGRCVCLPDKLRIPLAKALVEQFGSPENWSLSDLLAMGDMIALLDHISIGQINKDSMRRAAPHLIENSCFKLKYDSFPGRLDNPTFEEVCLASQYKGTPIRDGSGQSIKAYKRAVFDATLRNVELALKPAEILPTITTTTQQTVAIEEATTPVPMTQFQFSLRVANRASEAYRSRQLTLSQINRFSVLVNKLNNNTRTKVADVFNVPVTEVPIQMDAIANFIRTGRQSLTPLELQILQRETNKMRDQYAKDLITEFSWSEDDIGLDRATFCKFGPGCNATTESSDEEEAPFDSDFNLLRVFDGFGNSEDPLIRTNDKPLSTTVSPKSFCLAVEAAGFASSSLDLKDLESQPANEIYECLEILANLEWSDRPGFWNLIKDKIGDRIFNPDGRLQSGALTILMPILDVIETDRISANTELLTDPFSYLGALPGLTDKTTKAYAGKYSEVRGLATLLSMAEDGRVGAEALEAAALGNLVCGLPKGMVEDLVKKSDQQFNMLHILGSIVTNCRDEKILKALAKKVKVSASGDWKPSDVATFLRHGVFLAGFEPSKMAKWPPVVFNAFTPEIASHLTLNHLSALSPDQLTAIPVDAMSAFNQAGLSGGQGTPSFKNSQFEALTSKRESVIPLSWLDNVQVDVSRGLDEDVDKWFGKTDPEPEDNSDSKDEKAGEDSSAEPETEPETEPEPEGEASLSDGGTGATHLVAIGTVVASLVFLLILFGICWWKGKCCFQKEPAA